MPGASCRSNAWQRFDMGQALQQGELTVVPVSSQAAPYIVGEEAGEELFIPQDVGDDCS